MIKHDSIRSFFFLRNTCWCLNASHHQCFIEHNLANATLKVFMNLNPKRAKYQYISHSLGRFYWYFLIHHTKPSFSMTALFLSLSFLYLFIYLDVPGLICSSQDLQSSLQQADSCFCGICYLVPWLGIKPRLPALGMWSLSLWIKGSPKAALFLADAGNHVCESFPYYYGY